MMSPFEWAMVIMSALSLGTAATSGTDIDTEMAAPIPGGPSTNLTPIIGAGGAGLTPNLPANVPDLTGPTQATAAAAAAVPQTQVTTPPQLEGPPASRAGSREQEGPPVNRAGSPSTEIGIGQILAALPQAIAVAAPLLGLTDQPIPTQRPAPLAGGQPGQPVGQFAQPFGPGQFDIGRLLAALPGIRG